MVDDAVERLEKSVKSKEKCSYFFVSKEQMEKLIKEEAERQVKAERAMASAVTIEETPEE